MAEAKPFRGHGEHGVVEDRRHGNAEAAEYEVELNAVVHLRPCEHQPSGERRASGEQSTWRIAVEDGTDTDASNGPNREGE